MYNVQKFPDCCGLSIIHSLPMDIHALANLDETEFETQLKISLNKQTRAAVLVSITEHQRKKFKHILVRNGFKRIGHPFRNHQTNNIIFLYIQYRDQPLLMADVD